MSRFVASWIALGVGCLALGSFCNSAVANFADGRGFRFSSYTENRDPVSLLFAGGRTSTHCARYLNGPPLYSPTCVRTLIEGSVPWASRSCDRGGDRLSFRGGGTRAQTFALTSSRACLNQWHVRVWDDHDIDEPDDQFMVGGVHHEQVTGRTFPPHRGDMWEYAETVLEKAVNEDGWCTFNNWRVVPGQRPGIHRDAYNDGRISRLTMQPKSAGCGDA